jgi:ATP synthase I chain
MGDEAADLAATERRFRRNTYVVIGLGVAGGWLLGGVRMGLGVALGGALSIFNERWLRASAGAILGTAAAGDRRVPRWTATKFLLRYLVIAVVAGLAVWSGRVHLLGVGIGLAAFVGAVMIEAGYQIYLTFTQGGESAD